MLKASDNDKDKELFEFLLREERKHLTLFDELVKMLTRPEEWVESAEFGLREDY
jgi:rubrerythrin